MKQDSLSVNSEDAMFEHLFSSDGRKNANEVGRHLRRLGDLTLPNDPRSGKADRSENRHNRSIPALLCPWRKGKAIVSEAVMVTTKDIADQGIGLILKRPIADAEIVIVFYRKDVTEHEPWFFLGVKRNQIPIGGGFWSLGVEVKKFLSLDGHSELAALLPFAKRLLPSEQNFISTLA